MVNLLERARLEAKRFRKEKKIKAKVGVLRGFSSPQVPLARPRMSAQEQLERIRRNQECGRPLPRPASPRLLTLGRTLSPARRQPDIEQRVRGTEVGQWDGSASFAPSLSLSFPHCKMRMFPTSLPRTGFPDLPQLVLVLNSASWLP